MAQSGADAVKEAILRKINERDELKKKLSKLDFDINRLKDSYKILTGAELAGVTRRKPILDYVEDMLREHDKLHVDQMVDMLESEFQITAPKQSIASGLIRFHNQKKRFERVERNTFSLRK